MIYTVTLNPALDRAIWINKIRYDDPNRIKKEKKYAGGKGIDVSRVLTHLGVHNRALGFLGGYTGMEIEGILLEEGVYCDFTSISNETRTNIVLNVKESNQQLLLSAPGAAVKPVELTSFFKTLENLQSVEFVAFSGSLPPGLSPVIYERALEIVKSKGGRTFLDTDGENLKIGIAGKPHMIKPNIHELSRLVGRKLSALGEIVRAAVEVQQSGIEIVLVSIGARGIILVSEKEKYHAVPPQVKVVNTIGAGDSAVAGFIYGLTHRFSLKDCLTYAVAAGTATTLHPGTALAEQKDVEALAKEIKFQAI